MNAVKITFHPKSYTVKIKDEAKTQHFFFSVFTILQVISNAGQLYEHWGEYGSWQLYVFGFLFIVFIAFSVFYLFFNSYKNEIDLQNIKYYAEKPFLWFKLRYFKLSNKRLRFLNFKHKSDAPNDLLNYLDKYQINIKG